MPTPAWPPGEFESSFPQAAWMRAWGLPSWGANPFQQWMAGQAGPQYAGWLGNQLLPGATPSDFNPSAGMSGSPALTALRGARGQSSADQGQWLSDLGGTDALTNLLQSALGKGGKGYASPIANMLANRTMGLRRGWEAETQGGATGDTFLNYHMWKLGIS